MFFSSKCLVTTKNCRTFAASKDKESAEALPKTKKFLDKTTYAFEQ